ncbi:MAG: RidA family protein [Acidobacteriaceae bacterium]|nr:RidA family protein [Acidobacteriaceae bacterium]
MKEIITPEKPKAAGPYSPAVRLNGMVFLSGQIPLDPDTNQLVTGSIQEQCARVLENLKLVLAAAGLSFDDVVKTTVFLKDMNDFAQMNETYGGFFGATPPARTTVEVARLPRDVRIEIEAIAIDPHHKYPFAK